MIRRRAPLKRSRKPIPRKRAKPRRGPLRDPGYLKFLRAACRCVAEDDDNHSPSIEAAHGPVNGLGSKGPDNEALPLCRFHHLIQHAMGWAAFEAEYFGRSRQFEAAAQYEAYQIWRERSLLMPSKTFPKI